MENICQVSLQTNEYEKLCVKKQMLASDFFEKSCRQGLARWLETKPYNSKSFWSICM